MEFFRNVVIICLLYVLAFFLFENFNMFLYLYAFGAGMLYRTLENVD